MATKQFITLENLELYDSLLKNYVAAEDAKSIKSVLIDGNNLKFYDVEEPVGSTAPKYNITLPTPDLSNFVEKVIQGSNGKALIFNEDDGGGAKFEHISGVNSFVGVNDGGETGITGQLYTVKKDANGKNVGTRLNMTLNGFYYTNGANSSAFSELDEIATKRDVQSASAEDKTIYLKDISAGQSEYAKVYNLYQGEDPLDMTQNTFVGAINIPLSQVLQDAHLVTVTNGVDSDGAEVPIGMSDGKYIKLQFQNVSGYTYINVQDLVDVYTGGTTAEITVSIDGNNEITATINEISGTKIADGTIAKAKLVSAVQDAIDAGSTALQPEDIGAVDEQDIRDLFSGE